MLVLEEQAQPGWFFKVLNGMKSANNQSLLCMCVNSMLTVVSHELSVCCMTYTLHAYHISPARSSHKQGLASTAVEAAAGSHAALSANT